MCIQSGPDLAQAITKVVSKITSKSVLRYTLTLAEDVLSRTLLGAALRGLQACRLSCLTLSRCSPCHGVVPSAPEDTEERVKLFISSAGKLQAAPFRSCLTSHKDPYIQRQAAKVLAYMLR